MSQPHVATFLWDYSVYRSWISLIENSNRILSHTVLGGGMKLVHIINTPCLVCQVDLIMSEQAGNENTITPHSLHQNCIIQPKCPVVCKCIYCAQFIATKVEPYVPLSPILGLPLWQTRGFEDQVGDFYFSYHLYSSPSFFTISYHPLYSLVLCFTWILNPISRFSIPLFYYLILKGVEELKVLLCFVQSSFSFFSHLRPQVASKTMTFWGNTTMSLSLICLGSLTSSSLFESIRALNSRRHFSCSLNYNFKVASMEQFSCAFFWIAIIQSIIYVPEWNIQGQRI